MINIGTPVTVTVPGSAFDGAIGVAKTGPFPLTDNVNIQLQWSPLVLSFNTDELRVDCLICASHEQGALAPRHTASPRCESGGQSHCSCSTCF